MSDKPPFDAQRAAFFLIAYMVVFETLIGASGFAMCLAHASDIVSGNFKCDPDNRLVDLVGTAMAAALGYAAGRGAK